MSRRISQERAERIVRQFHRYEEDFAQRGIDRRRLLRMIAAGSAAATVLPVLVAAGAVTHRDVAAATARQNPPGGTPTRGGTIIIGTLGEANTINPLLPNQTEDIWRSKMLYGEFIELDPVSLEPRPNIAQEWTVSEDGREFTFKLRPNVTFSDGKPLTAADIEFTLYGILKKEVASPLVPGFLMIEGAQEYHDGTATAMSGITVVDDHTITMRLTEPNAVFLTSLRGVRPLPKHLLDGKDLVNDPFFQKPIGAGPFVFKSWTTGQDFVAERNPTYWEEGKPYLDGFTHRVIADSQTLVIALQTGQIEGSDYALPTRAEDLRQVPNLEVLVVPPGKDINGWSFGQKNNEKLADARVRRAIAMALDARVFASDFLLGLGSPATGPVPATHWAYNKNLQPIPYDPAAAKGLIEEAGASGMTLRCTTNAGNVLREDWVTFTQQGLGEIGITVEPDIKEWAQVVASATDGSFEAICPTFAPVLVDPDDLYESLHSASPQNVYGYANPQLDALLEEGRQTLDQGKRKAVYDQVQALLLEDVPVYWAWDRPFIYVTTKAFQGYENNLLTLFQELEDWWKPA